MATWLTEALIGWDGWAWDRVFASTTGPVASGRAGVLPPPARQPHRRPLSHRRHAAGRPHLPRTTLKRAGAMSTEVGWQSHPRAWAPRRGRGPGSRPSAIVQRAEVARAGSAAHRLGGVGEVGLELPGSEIPPAEAPATRPRDRGPVASLDHPG